MIELCNELKAYLPSLMVLMVVIVLVGHMYDTYVMRRRQRRRQRREERWAGLVRTMKHMSIAGRRQSSQWEHCLGACIAEYRRAAERDAVPPYEQYRVITLLEALRTPRVPQRGTVVELFPQKRAG